MWVRYESLSNCHQYVHQLYQECHGKKHNWIEDTVIVKNAVRQTVWIIKKVSTVTIEIKNEKFKADEWNKKRFRVTNYRRPNIKLIKNKIVRVKNREYKYKTWKINLKI